MKTVYYGGVRVLVADQSKMRTRLKNIMHLLPRYNNNFAKGPYKNGNYQKVLVRIYTPKECTKSYDLNDIIELDEMKKYLDKPYYVKTMYPDTVSHFRFGQVTPYLIIELVQEKS